MVNKEDFISAYLKPSSDGLDRSFTLALPDIDGLMKCGEFIVQGHLDNTYSTNSIAKFESASGVRLIEVYKNTEDREQKIFIRLVGTMSLVKKGYPFLIFDAAVSNVSPVTGLKDEISTRVAIHLPQADSAIRDLFFAALNTQATGAGVACCLREVQGLPDFWGPFWSAQFDGIDFDRIFALRNMAWASYDGMCSKISGKADFDYRPAQEQIVFKNAQAEHHIFKKMGLSVSAEAQAAFFSMLVAGI